jgi:S-(hydroxymethyl)glutathione dehydrogenase/alcohol dehydrogenase
MGVAPKPFRWRGQPVHSYANCSSFASVVTVKASQLVAVPGIEPATAALIGCAVSTGYGVVRNVAQVEAGQCVVVFGVGGIGVNALQTARLQGAAHVIAVDVDPARERIARRYGATAFVCGSRDDGVGELTQRVLSAAPAAVDTAIECSGSPVAIDAAVRVVGPGGVTALVGIPPPGTAAAVDVSDLLRGRRVVGSLNGAIDPARDLPDIVTLIREGRLDVSSQVTRVWPLAEVHDAVAAVRSGQVVRAILSHQLQS